MLRDKVKTILVLLVLLASTQSAAESRFSMCQRISGIAAQHVRYERVKGLPPMPINGSGFSRNVREIGYWAVDYAKTTTLEEADAKLFVRTKCLAYIDKAIWYETSGRIFSKNDIK